MTSLGPNEKFGQLLDESNSELHEAKIEIARLVAVRENLERSRDILVKRSLYLSSLLIDNEIPFEPSREEEPPTPISKAVEAAAMAGCTNSDTQAAYLRKYGWKLSVGNYWIDPEVGGAVTVGMAIAKQLQRNTKPFAYLLKVINPHHR